MHPPVGPIIFQLGPLTMRWYGLLLMTGVIVAAWVASRYVARRGENSERIWDMLLWILIPGFIGARLYYVFIQSPRGEAGLGHFLANPISILQIWNGGIHIYGGLIVGSIATILYCRMNKLPLLTYLDGLALGLPLGQALGRVANFINQELYGPPTTLPWGLRIDPEHRIAPYNDAAQFPASTRFHPLFLYESLWNLVGFGLIFWISRRYEQQLRPGSILLMYLIWYPLGRFWIEFIRTDSWFFAGTPFNVVHVLSALTIIGAAITLYLRQRDWTGSATLPSAAVAGNQ
jgi:phosphatidylglycerol---prolipoprotein diacylglyceryl transferase